MSLDLSLLSSRPVVSLKASKSRRTVSGEARLARKMASHLLRMSRSGGLMGHLQMSDQYGSKEGFHMMKRGPERERVPLIDSLAHLKGKGESAMPLT